MIVVAFIMQTSNHAALCAFTMTLDKGPNSTGGSSKLDNLFYYFLIFTKIYKNITSSRKKTFLYRYIVGNRGGDYRILP